MQLLETRNTVSESENALDGAHSPQIRHCARKDPVLADTTTETFQNKGQREKSESNY